MSYDNQDPDKNYQVDDDGDRQSRRKDLLLGKKRESKKGRYVMFDEEDSDESSSIISEDVKSPSKMKKSKAFSRFSGKKKEKEEKKDKDSKKDEKEKEKKKEDKDGKKLKLKSKKKSKHMREEEAPKGVVDKPIFGVPLAVAVERNKSHDGVELPALFRECIDYIEEHGLSCEGIYRISGVKSKVQQLKDSYNSQLPVYLEEHEPNIVASLLKQFLRELPEPVLTSALMPKFEEASVIKNERRRLEAFVKLVGDLPACNRLLLSWIIVHMMHVIERQKENKMSLQNVSIVLSPTMQISHRVLNVLFGLAKQLFKDVDIKRYKPPIKPTTSKWSLELPDNPAQLEEELSKQESLLNALHEELNSGIEDPEKEEQLWEVQRVVTQLKRKIKVAMKKKMDAADKQQKEDMKKSLSMSDDLGLRLELREAPLKKQAPPPPEEIDGGSKDGKVAEETVILKTETVASAKKAQAPEPPSNENQAESGVKGESEEVKGQGQKSINKIVVQADVEPQVQKKDVCDGELSEEQVNEQEKSEADNVKEIDNKVEEDVAVAVSAVDDVDSQKPETVIKSDKNAVLSDSAENITQKVEEDEDSFEQQVEDILEKEEGNHAVCTSDEEEAVTQEVSTQPQTKVESEQEVVVQSQTEVDKEQEQKVVEKSDEQKVIESDNKTDKSDDVVESQEKTQKTEKKARVRFQTDEETDKPETSEPKPEKSETNHHEQQVQEATEVKGEVKGHRAGEKVKVKAKKKVKRGIIEVIDMDITTLEEELKKRPDDETDTSPQEVDLVEEEEEELSEEDEEIVKMQEELTALQLEEEELLTIESELRQKIETEKNEIDRLHQEMAELHYLRQDSDLEEMSSSSDSSYESEDEDDLQEMLNQLLADNETLERQNNEMSAKIHEERMICLGVKVQIGMLQQKQLESSMGSESMLEKDLLLF